MTPVLSIVSPRHYTQSDLVSVKAEIAVTHFVYNNCRLRCIREGNLSDGPVIFSMIKLKIDFSENWLERIYFNKFSYAVTHSQYRVSIMTSLMGKRRAHYYLYTFYEHFMALKMNPTNFQA